MKKDENYSCLFFYNIHGLICDNIEIQLSELHNLYISFDENKIHRFFNEIVRTITGTAQYDLAISSKKFVWSEFVFPKTENYDRTHAWFLKASTIASNAFWLVKDNAIRFNTGHLSYGDDSQITVKSNTVSSHYSNCLGNKSDTNYSQNEIIKALKYFDFLFNITLNKIGGSLDHTGAEANRINRAYYFIDLARKTYDIGTKVSLHCSALECLFSVATTELRHRLSETIANFLGEEYEEKRNLYEQIKEIYDLRSSVTHGSGINKKLFKNNEESLNRIGMNCDNIVRDCLSKIINDGELKKIYFENNNETINNYFTELIFK
ncbi:HEPN domain-containing protein [Flavobacterium sp. MFBS3-15]|uniref:HEPN domain-containing protein n=1 Tax=Flavobacterium sp. MFBS3-15 TaxID=2989816 RepID=UPI0022363390|nr:HEPN domain-containing protein [Flavobacterium sp. MFBS3-15]MCW4470193.1 HEPN domain-containing protein [Flavobacterium sp. MFBS3-15]